MKQYVTDTHCLLWFIAKDRHLPARIRAVFEDAKAERAQILVPSMVLVETIFLVQRQRVPEKILAELLDLSEEQDASFSVLPLDMQIVRAVHDFGPTAVKELGDRVIAATARALDLPLLTVDEEIINSGMVKVIE